MSLFPNRRHKRITDVLQYCVGFNMEISYNELRCKEVVNLQNGAKMGKIVDLIFDSNGKNVLGVVVPGIRKLFKNAEDIFVPWCNISKIGDDVILVSLNMHALTNVTRGQRESNKLRCLQRRFYRITTEFGIL